MTSLNPHAKRPYVWLYTIAIVISVAVGILVAASQLKNEPIYTHAQLLPSAKAVPEFNLLDQTELPIDQSLWRARWSLVFFGFTTCPDICPLELQKLAKLLRLANTDIALQVIFISVDPERDRSATLREYTNFFHPDIVALSGTNADLARTAQFFGAAYDRSVIIGGKLFSVPAGIDMPDHAGTSYQVNHSTRIFIVNPEGEYVGSFMPPFEAEELWSDLTQMFDQ